MMRFWMVVAVLGAFAGVSAHAAEVGSPRAGLALAHDICAECHVVHEEQLTVSVVGLPSFPDIAAQPERTETWLRAFLVTPHHQMPNYVFRENQIDDLVAYFESLKVK